MYQLERITGAYKNEVEKIRDINEAIKQLIMEAQTLDGIEIFSDKGMNDEMLLKVRLSYANNNIEISFKYMELIDGCNNFNKKFSSELKNLNEKDKIIRIIEDKAEKEIIQLAYIIK